MQACFFVETLIAPSHRYRHSAYTDFTAAFSHGKALTSSGLVLQPTDKPKRSKQEPVLAKHRLRIETRRGGRKPVAEVPVPPCSYAKAENLEDLAQMPQLAADGSMHAHLTSSRLGAAFGVSPRWRVSSIGTSPRSKLSTFCAANDTLRSSISPSRIECSPTCRIGCSPVGY